MNKLNLKWKISLLMVCVLLVTLLTLSYQIYLSSSKTIQNQVNKNLITVQYLYKDKINSLISSINKQVKSVSNNPSTHGALEVIMGLAKGENDDEKMLEYFNTFLPSNFLVYSGNSGLDTELNLDKKYIKGICKINGDLITILEIEKLIQTII